MSSTDEPAYVTRLSDLQSEAVLLVITALFGLTVVLGVAYIDQNTSPMWLLFGIPSAFLSPAFLLVGSLRGRWIVVDTKEDSFGMPSVLPHVILPWRTSEVRVRMSMGGKTARTAYRRLYLNALSKGIAGTEVLPLVSKYPPSPEVRDLVVTHRITDPEAIEGVLTGGVPIEWARAYSAGQVGDSA